MIKQWQITGPLTKTHKWPDLSTSNLSRFGCDGTYRMPEPARTWREVKVSELPERIRAGDARDWIDYLLSIEPTAYEIVMIKPYTILVLPTEQSAADWCQS